MLYQLPGIYFLLGTASSNISLLISNIINNNFLVGAVFSSVSLLISNCINNNFQLKREREQRIWQVESERQKWYREKIYESYRNSIHILTKVIQAQYKSQFTSEYDDSYNPEHDLDLELLIKNLYFEFSSEFSLIIVGHPDKETKEINELTTIIIEKGVFRNPFTLRELITEIMEKDPRIKDVNEEYLKKQKSSKILT
ncbi:hypothetical protein QUA41_17630 [Microcoleus sp. Pol11C1]|uniref:hypothetical protein n=1 Tax=unclassified Microcoleus TaxID=2642155 RepID=UPI002FCF4F3D